ncbi:MAG: amino acid adenylation domain-containing protein [Jatrophihabitantaceae bacterium]
MRLSATSSSGTRTGPTSDPGRPSGEPVRPVGDPTRPERYPALPTQHGMVLNNLRQPDDGVDVLQLTLDWAEPLQPAPFEAAWRSVVRWNPVLRTGFQLDAEHGLVQVVDPAAVADLRWRELPAAAGAEPDAAFESFLRADRRERFDLARPPLARLTVLRRPDAHRANVGAHRAVLTFHHALLDGWSMRLLVDELSRSYAAERTGRAVPRLPRQEFREFVRWWQMADQTSSEQFWTNYLADTVLPRSLPGCLGAQPGRPAEPRKLDSALSAADSELVRQAAEAAGLSSSILFNAAWALLRARYGGVDDVVLAVTRSCRRDSIPDADQVLGLLINTVPLRVRIDSSWTGQQLLAAVHEGTRRIRQHQLSPMADILSWAGLPVDTPLIDSLLMYDRCRLQTGLAGGEAAPVSVRVDRLPSYPLTVCAYAEPELQLGMIWDGARFVDGAAERMLEQLRALLVALARHPSRPLAELGTDAEAELRAGWHGAESRAGWRGAESRAGWHGAEPGAGWRGAGAGYPRDATLPELFAAQVAERPEAIALVTPLRSWSYAELDRHSNRLAWALRRRGVGTDVPVAVALPRGAELIATLLAVVKAGGAYLPIDPGSPPARVAGMVAGARLVLVGDEPAAGVPAGLPLVQLAELTGGSGEQEQDGPLPTGLAHPLSLAYFNYTSGSTGVPKGVAVPHRAVVRLISDPTFATLGPGQRLLQLASIAFDAATLEIWGALLTGATLVLPPAGPLGLPEIARLLRDSGASLVWLTAGLFHQLAEADAGALAEVEQLLAGGDVLNPDVVRAVLATRAGRPLVNGYGPTENTTFTACQVLTDPAEVGSTVPIGRPIQHTTVQVLDAELRPVPIGVAGELYTGGDGLARGYHGAAAATARAFVPNPDGQGGRLYRTGDLARWRADGVLEFLGRADDQVKIRGFRVEPAEVAAVLRTFPGVREAVVLVRGDDAARHLVGYVTPADGVEPASVRPSLLREFVRYRLPEYLVPAGLAVLDRLPLNANGKLDRAALPEPEQEVREPVSPPRGDTECRLAEIWRLLLVDDRTEVGRDDSFFALGGNSLAAARLMFRIREAFGVELPLGSFYSAPTLAASAATIDAARSAGGAASTPAGPIGRRSRADYRVGPAASGTKAAPSDTATVPSGSATVLTGTGTVPSGTATAPSGTAPGPIGRRDRGAYRVADPRAGSDRPAEPAPHLVPLTEDWALWRTFCLRAAGFPVELLAALGDPKLAAAADAVLTGRDGDRSGLQAEYAAEFPAAVGRLSAALHAAASLPALREAVAWQNRHALSTGIDSLIRRGPAPASRNTKHRQHEALVASYLQRYCAKNDTIGFFGPVGWSQIDDGAGIRIAHDAAGPVRARVTYLEGWAVRAVMASHVAGLRPWLVPRRMPFLGLDGDRLRPPLAPPVPLAPAQAAVLRACDGVRDANAVAAEVLADPAAELRGTAEVFAVLGRLSDAHRLAWQLELAPQDIRPERSMAQILARVTDPAVRAPAAAALARLTEARDELANAGGDPDRVAKAMAALEESFTRETGIAATRRAGALYAGRTLAYEECLRADTVRLGADALDGARAALGLVLDSARWFTAEGGQLYARLFAELYRQRAAELGSAEVPFADLWLLANNALFDQPPTVIEPARRALRERWSAILGLSTAGSGVREIRLTAAELADRLAAAFPVRPRVWPTAAHHSPDLMIAEQPGGRPLWVLGEIHPSIVTTRYASWVAFQDDPAAARAALRHDLGGPTVFLAETAEEGGVNARLSHVLDSPDDPRLVYAHDSCGYPPANCLLVGDCDVLAAPSGLRVRRRSDGAEFSLLEVVGDLLSAVLVQTFQLVPPAAHLPRIRIDDLVISRETWTFEAAEPGFADTADEPARYLQARAWALEHGLPRHVFVRCTGERKPIYADLTSLVSIDLIARAVRRCRRQAGGTVGVVEMLPSPDQTWLADAEGRRYTAELRMVAVDQKLRG